MPYSDAVAGTPVFVNAMPPAVALIKFESRNLNKKNFFEGDL